MFNVVGKNLITGKTIMIEPHLTETQAMKMCEAWGWTDDDGSKRYTMIIEEEKEEN